MALGVIYFLEFIKCHPFGIDFCLCKVKGPVQFYLLGQQPLAFCRASPRAAPVVMVHRMLRDWRESLVTL